ncbi:MAG TPA: winged helix DNA-binding domain-containing protein [Capsulimonadaceae bacterium]|jgi:hypothetical protein
MTPNEISHLRLANQRIVNPDAATARDVVARLGAMQAQDYGGMLWSVGLRLPGSTEVSVEAAVAERSIVRTWMMRGTIHLVAAEDLHWMLDLLGPRVIASTAKRHEQLELDSGTYAKCEKAAVGALQGGAHLTREELLGAIAGVGVTVDGPRSYHIPWILAYRGVICFGARRGKQQAFTLLSEWVADAKPRDREEALAELAKRYFVSHGPATLKDFAWWSSLPMADARAALEYASGGLVKETVDGKTYWLSANTPSAAKEAPLVHLLPGFDEYMLGYQDRSPALPAEHAAKIVPGGNGIFLPTIVSAGRVVGTWKRTVTKTKVTVTPVPFTKLAATELKAITKASERYGSYLSLAAALTPPNTAKS